MAKKLILTYWEDSTTRGTMETLGATQEQFRDFQQILRLTSLNVVIVSDGLGAGVSLLLPHG
jgi:predicted phosphoribosyltransferase